MGQQSGLQGRSFLNSQLDDWVPADQLLRKIDAVLESRNIPQCEWSVTRRAAIAVSAGYAEIDKGRQHCIVLQSRAVHDSRGFKCSSLIRSSHLLDFLSHFPRPGRYMRSLFGSIKMRLAPRPELCQDGLRTKLTDQSTSGQQSEASSTGFTRIHFCGSERFLAPPLSRFVCGWWGSR